MGVGELEAALYDIDSDFEAALIDTELAYSDSKQVVGKVSDSSPLSYEVDSMQAVGEAVRSAAIEIKKVGRPRLPVGGSRCRRRRARLLALITACRCRHCWAWLLIPIMDCRCRGARHGFQ